MPQCIQCTTAFEVRPEDREFYKTFDAPDPVICPDCRLQKRLTFRNERNLYHRKSALSGKNIISIYHPDVPHPVYATDEWWGDKWDGLSYGRDFDFNRPFFDQFRELQLMVPRIALFNVNPENSDYCQQAYDNKNCYLCMVVTTCEDCMYLSHINKARDSFDSTLCQNIELCYECLDSDKLYACVESQSCQNSSNLLFCYDLIGCRDCFGCFGLRNKQNYIFNKPYPKEEYELKVASLELWKSSNYLKYKKYFQDLSPQRVHRATRNINTFDSTGNYLINCAKAHECFDSFQLEECAYSTWVFDSHHIYDTYGLGGSEFVLDCLGNEKVNKVAWSTFVSDSGDVFYSDLCFYSLGLFGCVGLRNKKNCILNKQYSPEDYKALRAKIVEHMKRTGEWGQFFPASLSPYCYNETAAQNYFPFSHEEAIAKGYRWREPDPKEYQPQNIIIPESIKDVKPEVTQAILACQCTLCATHKSPCGKNYKIMPQELVFYKKQNLPMPLKCPDCRYYDRLRLRQPRKLYSRACTKCQAPIQTSFAPERPEQVFCEKCYAETVS